MSEVKFTILGCGSSGGVPRIGNNWGACDPNNPRNRRLRCSLLVQRIGANGTTNVLIDTSPDMRQQLLNANVGELDAVIYTHEHADHLHGLDDLRMVVINMRELINVYAAPSARAAIMGRFGYTFETPAGSPYPPILKMNDLPENLIIDGAGGSITIDSFDVEHGNITARAIRINDLLYTPDISSVPADAPMGDLDCWILDALRYTPHPSHTHFAQSLEWIEKYAPKRAILTNMHVDLDYQTICDDTPDHVTAAYDGLQITAEI
ncbi:MBL fold metallo-hydrolase [Paramylibacter ulvae]|nr:MBL fold metallo-hydrolase [Amylibacter ulvae]